MDTVHVTDDEPWLDRAIDELYAIDLALFTTRRSELAKAARAAGDKDGAVAIAALRKPTQSAFTINRLARTDQASIETLIEVGAELRGAQRTADAKQLRELNSRRRTVLDTLTWRAFEIIGQQSPSTGQREEVNATLTAALTDPTVAEQLKQGILVRAAESSGFGFSPPELTLIRSPRQASGRPVRGAAETDSKPDAEPTPSRAAEPTPSRGGKAARRSEAAAQRSEAAATRRREADREAAAEQRRGARDAAIAKARAEADSADAAVDDAVASIDSSRELIRLLQRQLADAKKALDDSQARAKSAESRQRKAREALNRASGSP